MSIGIKVGRALGWTGAAVVHATATSVAATGRFGQDIAIGTRESYSDNAARFAAARALANAGRGEQAIAIEIVTPAPKRRARATA